MIPYATGVDASSEGFCYRPTGLLAHEDLEKEGEVLMLGVDTHRSTFRFQTRHRGAAPIDFQL